MEDTFGKLKPCYLLSKANIDISNEVNKILVDIGDFKYIPINSKFRQQQLVFNWGKEMIGLWPDKKVIRC